MAARSTPPATDLREQYVEQGTDRYAQLETDIEQALAQAGVDNTDADTLAAAVASWLVARQRDTGVRPADAARADWMDDVVDGAYRDGITYARQALRDAGVALDQSTPDARLNQPAHRGAVQTLRVDQREAWQRLAADLEDEVTQAVRETAQQGASRTEVAQAVRDRVEATGANRAELIGETEPSRTFHRAALEEWSLSGVQQVELDWVTMPGACADCEAGAAESPYTIESARGLIPHHPRCRCTWQPVADSMEGPRR